MPQLLKNNKWLIWIPIGVASLIMVVVFGYSRFQHTDDNHFYVPYSKDRKGYIGKAEALFAELLTIDKKVKISDGMSVVEQLNRRYPAFEFALPEDVREGECMLSDIRLVRINEKYLDSIETKSLKTFYYASTLRTDLQSQREKMYQKIFNVYITKADKSELKNKDDYMFTVRSIKMIPELYKITFSSHPWTGTISGQSYSKIDESNSLFLVYGNAIMPLCRQDKKRDSQNNYQVDFASNTIMHDNADIDLYDYYNALYEKSSMRTRLVFAGNEKESIVLQVIKDDDKKGDMLLFELSTDFDIRCNDTIFHATSYASHNTSHEYLFKPDEKSVRVLVSHGNSDDKVAEFYIFRKNLLNLLSYSVNTNKGKERKHIDDRYTDDFTKQVVHVFNSNDMITVDSVNLSLDPALSKMLEREIENYVENQLFEGKRQRNRENIEMSVCIVNSANGEVLAASSYSTQKVNPLLKLDRRNPNTQRRYIGSCFKPLMTLATVLMYSGLMNMEINGSMWKDFGTEEYTKNNQKKTGYNMEVLGYPIRLVPKGIHGYFKKTSMQEYISESNDAYPIILAMYGFSDPNGEDLPTKSLKTEPVRLNGRYPHSLMVEKDKDDTTFTLRNTWINDKYDIHNSRFAGMLDELYNISSADIKNDSDKQNSPELYVWRMYNANRYDSHDSIYFPNISPEITNMSYNSWTGTENFRGKIISWVLGQGDNSWCPLKLAEAWARMSTKRRVELSLIKGDSVCCESLSQRIQERDQTASLRWDTCATVDFTWNSFLDMFAAAQKSGLLSPMWNTVQNVDTNLVLLGKTGTPDEFKYHIEEVDSVSSDMQFDLGLYTFSLMTNEQFKYVKGKSNTAPQNAGISVVVRIVHTYKKEKGFGTDFTGDKIQSSHAHKFFAGNPDVLKKVLFYTSKLFQ